MSIVIACITALSGFAGVCIGGLLTHRLTEARDRRAQSRTARVELLLRLNKAVSASAVAGELTPDLAPAINELLVIGTDDEIDAADRCMAELADAGSTDFRPLQTAIRRNLRRDLGLSDRPLRDGLLFFGPRRIER